MAILRQFVLFLIAIPIAVAQTPNSYRLQASINPEAQTLRATAVVQVSAPADGQMLTFILNKGLKVASVRCGECESFRFATDEASPYRYISDGAPLYVKLQRPVRAGKLLKVTFEYAGTLVQDRAGPNMLTPEWTELALYIGWFPYMPEMARFRYVVDVSFDSPYQLTGEGTVQRRFGGWRVSESADTFDIVLVAAKQLNFRREPRTGTTIVYGKAFNDAMADSTLRQLDKTVETYSKWFGSPSTGRLTFVLGDRQKGGGYTRPGFVSMMRGATMTDAELQRGLVGGIGHEVGHLWFTGASVTTWEDWLNESFAEYSSWLMVRQSLGQTAFDGLVSQMRKRTENKPAIWGIDRNSDEAYAVLYNKGALALHDLAQTIGEDRFLVIVAQSTRMRPRTTTAFLEILQRSTSPEIRENFEAQLRR